MRRLEPGSLTVALLLAALPSWASAAGKIVRHPYLQSATPRSMVVVWRAEGAASPFLRYGSRSSNLNMEVVPVKIMGRGLSPKSAQYEARITGLQPATRYFYGVFDGEEILAGGDESHYFRTHPPGGKDSNLRIWILGDSGVAKRWPAAVLDGMLTFSAATGRLPDLALHVGDIAYYNGSEADFQAKFFKPFGPFLRNTVLWPAPGNHDTHSMRFEPESGPYFDIFVIPSNGEAGGAPSGREAYYSFDHGGVHFVSLESTVSDRGPNGKMLRWLRSDLAAVKAEWLIAFWHHAPYSRGRHDSSKEREMIEMRTNVLPLLEKKGADLVVTGHAHLYARSMLVKGGKGHPSRDGRHRKKRGLRPHGGTVYLISGNGGQTLDVPLAHPVMKSYIAKFGSVIIDIEGGVLTGRMIDVEGRVLDTFSIVKD